MANRYVFVLRHLESQQYICAMHEGEDYVIGFSNGDTAFQFRAELGQQEYAEICSVLVKDFPTRKFWFDSQFVELDPEDNSNIDTASADNKDTGKQNCYISNHLHTGDNYTIDPDSSDGTSC